jgi:perosamine synthetase
VGDLVQSLPDLTYFRGRAALYAILKALGVGRGDEVAVQAFTCVAVAEAICATGARPVWVDIEPGGVNMDPAQLTRRLTRATRAIVVQHTYGIPAGMDRIMAAADERGLPVVEDCCHTLSSRLGERPVGTFGIAAFYSFEWGKPIVAGIGGAARANDAAVGRVLADGQHRLRRPSLARVLRNEAQYIASALLVRPALYWPARSAFRLLSAAGIAERSYNPVRSQPSPEIETRMAAPVRRRLVRRLREIDAVTRRAARVVEAYRRGLAGTRLDEPTVPEGAAPVYARFPLFTARKEAALSMARRAGVELAGWYDTPIHPLGPDRWGEVGYERGVCPEAERAAGRIVTLPTGRFVTARQIGRAAEALSGA